MSKKESAKKLFYYNIEYSGNGNNIISQSPSESTYLAAGSIIRLLLGN